MSLRIPVGKDDHIQGDVSAPVVLVEYGDYQCPYCGQAAPLVKELQQRFGSDVCLVFRNFPLSNVHPQALSAAITAEFAGGHGRFWEAHDLLFANQAQLGDALYAEIAQSLGLPLPGLREALKGDGFTGRIEADFEGGVRSGVNGTPCFFVNGDRFTPRSGFEELFDVVGDVIAAAQGKRGS